MPESEYPECPEREHQFCPHCGYKHKDDEPWELTIRKFVIHLGLTPFPAEFTKCPGCGYVFAVVFPGEVFGVPMDTSKKYKVVEVED